MGAPVAAHAVDMPTHQAYFCHALEAYNNAVCNLSGFDVKAGAALLAKKADSTFEVFTGAKIQTALPSKTVCASCGALSSAMAKGYKKFEALIIASNSGNEGPCTTCSHALFYTLSQKDLALYYINKNGVKVLER